MTPLSDPSPDLARPLRRIAVGSCLKQSAEAQVLQRVLAQRPEVMLWIGDNIYGDTTDPAQLRRKYEILGANPRFQALFAACPNLAVWDDHDFGLNDAGSDLPSRIASRDIFFDFWKIDPRSPRRRHQGVYGAWIVGPPGQRTQIVMLDGRYNRSPRPAADGVMLGEVQWRWLEAQLARPAELRLVVSGVQVVAHNPQHQENWAAFARERARLFDLLRRRRAAGVVFVSGDTHRAELNVERGALGYDAWDLTASSLDQVNPRESASPDLFWGAYRKPNFGVVAVEWEGADPLVKLQIHDGESGAAVLSHWLNLSALQPR